MMKQFLSVVFVFAVFVTASIGQTPKLLFSFSEAPNIVSDKDRNSPASVREANVDFLLDANLIGSESKLTIPLFDGELITATRLFQEGLSTSENHVTWRGKNDIGGVASDVILTFGRNAVNGLIYSKNKVYEVTDYPWGNDVDGTRPISVSRLRRSS